MVKSIGADEVIDYTKEEFTKNGKTYDAISDAVDKTSFSRCKSFLKPTGVYLTVGMGSMILLEKIWNLITSHKKTIFGIANFKVKDLIFLRDY